jgi:voltage-gated potassium channel
MASESYRRENDTLKNERRQALAELEAWLEIPMLFLGFAWLALMLVEYMWGLNPLAEATITLIWIVFIADFLVKFSLAPDRVRYLKSNWLTIVALIVPALRVFRVFRVLRLLRVARATRGLRLIRIITSLNRGMGALRSSMARRGFGYVAALSGLVILIGSAGIYAFENDSNPGLSTYSESLWWTAMVLTSIGSEYWPKTAEGRMLGFLLALYGFGVFGYVTATLATFFIGRDAEADEGEVAGAKSLEELRVEIAALRTEVKTLRETIRNESQAG